MELRLWYTVLNSQNLNQRLDQQRISIYHVIKLSSNNYFGEDPIHYSAREIVSLEKDGYVSFNITTALRQWIESREEPRGSFYLEVYVERLQTTDEFGELFFQSPAAEIIYANLEGSYSKTTQLVLRAYSEDTIQRRQTENGTCQSRNCCKRTLIVDTHRDLNWTWVLQPSVIPAHFCSGYCPVYWPAATNHTIVSMILSEEQENLTGAPSPCCVPNKFSSLPLLIIYRNSIELITLDDISIESCICR